MRLRLRPLPDSSNELIKANLLRLDLTNIRSGGKELYGRSISRERLFLCDSAAEPTPVGLFFCELE